VLDASPTGAGRAPEVTVAHDEGIPAAQPTTASDKQEPAVPPARHLRRQRHQFSDGAARWCVMTRSWPSMRGLNRSAAPRLRVAGCEPDNGHRPGVRRAQVLKRLAERVADIRPLELTRPSPVQLAGTAPTPGAPMGPGFTVNELMALNPPAATHAASAAISHPANALIEASGAGARRLW